MIFASDSDQSVMPPSAPNIAMRLEAWGENAIDMIERSLAQRMCSIAKFLRLITYTASVER